MYKQNKIYTDVELKNWTIRKNPGWMDLHGPGLDRRATDTAHEKQEQQQQQQTGTVVFFKTRNLCIRAHYQAQLRDDKERAAAQKTERRRGTQGQVWTGSWEHGGKQSLSPARRQVGLEGTTLIWSSAHSALRSSQRSCTRCPCPVLDRHKTATEPMLMSLRPHLQLGTSCCSGSETKV